MDGLSLGWLAFGVSAVTQISAGVWVAATTKAKVDGFHERMSKVEVKLDNVIDRMAELSVLDERTNGQGSRIDELSSRISDAVGRLLKVESGPR